MTDNNGKNEPGRGSNETQSTRGAANSVFAAVKRQTALRKAPFNIHCRFSRMFETGMGELSMKHITMLSSTHVLLGLWEDEILCHDL